MRPNLSEASRPATKKLSRSEILKIIDGRLKKDFLKTGDLIKLLKMRVDIAGLKKPRPRAKPKKKIEAPAEPTMDEVILQLEKENHGQQHPVGQGREAGKENESGPAHSEVQGP
jgi:hypothetical protein